ncbi:hypothetical protein Tco_0324066 [Tanacetum coccineum]
MSELGPEYVAGIADEGKVTKFFKENEKKILLEAGDGVRIYPDAVDVIVNGDLEEEPTPTRKTFAPPAPKTAKQLAARRNQERVKSILLLAIPDEYLLKFHNVADAKSLWEAIKSRFGDLRLSPVEAFPPIPFRERYKPPSLAYTTERLGTCLREL